MIDFRYHLVSIVSIFLALAVGIVLGAGPLKGEIGDTLSKEVAGLRKDKADLNNQLADARAGAEARDAYIGETNPRMLAGSLQDRRVAVVVLPGSDGGVAESSAASLASAGATVVSTTSVSEDWVTTDEATVAARDTAVQQVAAAAGVDVSDSGSVSSRDVLLAALLTAPSQADDDPVPSVTATTALDDLSSADLLDIDAETFEPADLVLVVSGVATRGDQEAQQQAAGRWVDLIVALDARSAGTLVAGEATTLGEGASVLAGVRSDATATEGVSTVDDAGSALGQASVVHGLVQQSTGGVGQYGLAAGAEAPYAPVPAS